MKRGFLVSSVILILSVPAISGYTKEDAVRAATSILEQNGYVVSLDETYGLIKGEKDQDGFIIQLSVRLTKDGQKSEYVVNTVCKLPDLSKYTPEQTKLANKTSKEQVKVVNYLIKKRFKYFNALEKYVKSHFGLTPETIEAMKYQELTVGLTYDQATFIMKEKYYRYESMQTVSSLLTGLANVLDAAGGGSGSKYQYEEYDNKVHCKKAKVTDDNDPNKIMEAAYYYYRDPKSNQSFWLNGQYVNVKNYNAEAGETPIMRLYFEDNKLIRWEDLQEIVVR